jgi:hypothetical protein
MRRPATRSRAPAGGWALAALAALGTFVALRVLLRARAWPRAHDEAAGESAAAPQPGASDPQALDVALAERNDRYAG